VAGGDVEGAPSRWALKVVLSVVGVGSGEAPGVAILADAGKPAIDADPPSGARYDGGALPGVAEFPAAGALGRADGLAEGEAAGLAVDWRERALRAAESEAFPDLPVAIAPTATAAPPEITTTATTATT
jgi:hypothetical protein